VRVALLAVLALGLLTARAAPECGVPPPFGARPPDPARMMNAVSECCPSSTPGAAGAAVDGVALSLVVLPNVGGAARYPSAFSVAGAPTERRVADPLKLTAELRNVSGEAIEPGFARHARTDLTIVDPAGKATIWPLNARPGLFASFPLGPGKSLRMGFQWVTSYPFFPKPGTYLVRLAVHGGNGARVTAWESNAVALTIFSAPPGSRWIPPATPAPTSGVAIEQTGACAAASQHTPWGTAAHGLVLSLTADRAVVRLGDPIRVVVELRNVSGRTQQVFYGKRSSTYEFAIVNRRNGRAVPHWPPPRQTLGGGSYYRFSPIRLDPATSAYEAFRLERLYQFTEPGVYSVQVTKATVGLAFPNGAVRHNALELRSNTIVITVTR